MKKLAFNKRIEPSYPVGENIASANALATQGCKKFLSVYACPHHVNVICRGSSGAILAALFCVQLPDHIASCIIHIKKDGERSHCGTVSNGYVSSGINVIIDDFIDTGRTLREIHKEMKNRYATFHPHVLIVAGDYRKELVLFEPDYLIENL